MGTAVTFAGCRNHRVPNSGSKTASPDSRKTCSEQTKIPLFPPLLPQERHEERSMAIYAEVS